jgi:hypothetical protein
VQLSMDRCYYSYVIVTFIYNSYNSSFQPIFVKNKNKKSWGIPPQQIEAKEMMHKTRTPIDSGPQ